MNFVEYWLLDNVFERPLPFYHLFSDFDEYDVRRLWWYDRTKLLDGLEALLERGAIKLHDGQCPRTAVTRAELDNYLDSECLAYRDDGWVAPTYELTETGGKTWEQLSRPNWNGYVSEGWPDIVEQGDDAMSPSVLKGVMTPSAVNRERIIEYISGLTANHPWSIVPGTETWDTVSPFQITYWKKLPAGVRLTCQSVYDRSKPSTGDGYGIWWDSNWKWYTPPAFAKVSG